MIMYLFIFIFLNSEFQTSETTAEYVIDFLHLFLNWKI